MKRHISLTVAGAAQVSPNPGWRTPCFPFNCMRRSAHTSTKVRASLGPRALVVKETPAAKAYRTGRRVLSYARVWCPHMRSHVQLNGKQTAPCALNLCCPRNGKRPVAREAVLSRRACVFHCHCLTNPDGKAKRMRPPARIPARRGGGEHFAAGRWNPRGTDMKALKPLHRMTSNSTARRCFASRALPSLTTWRAPRTPR